MKRLCRRLAVTVAVLVWLGALVYLLVLSRRRLPELGSGAARGGAGGGETASNQVRYTWVCMLPSPEAVCLRRFEF